MNPIEFARNLFALRMERKLTVEDLAEALEITPETVCEWECAKTSPSLDQMNRLAKLYGIPLDEVIRNPKPIDPTAFSAPEPSVPEPTELPETAEETESETESEPEETVAPNPEPRRGRKKKKLLWDLITVGLLLAVIGIALYVLLNPELLPLG